MQIVIFINKILSQDKLDKNWEYILLCEKVRYIRYSFYLEVEEKYKKIETYNNNKVFNY